MSQDRGFKKSHGFNQEDEMDNPRGQVGSDDHGWAPDVTGEEPPEEQPRESRRDSAAEERQESGDR